MDAPRRKQYKITTDSQESLNLVQIPPLLAMCVSHKVTMEGDDIDFSGIDEDLEQFQQDDIVRQALRDGVDLRGYARDIQMELREVRLHPPC